MLLSAKPRKQPPSAGDEFAAAAKQWHERWEVQAVRRGSENAGAGLQAAKALGALAALAQQAAAHRRPAPQTAIAAACNAALQGVAGPLLSSPTPRVVSAALAEVAAIARVAPGAIAFGEVGAAIMRLMGQGGDDGFRAAWLADRCLSSAAWRAGDVWAALSAADGRAALLALMERQAADRDGSIDAGPCPLRHHISVVATLAGASDRVAAQLLGLTVADASRWLRAVAGVHAACPFHDPTRDAAVRLVACCCSVPVLQSMLADAGSEGAEARRLVLSVLHSVLRRPVALGDPQSDVRLWILAAQATTLPQLWRSDPDPGSGTTGDSLAGSWDGPEQQRKAIVAAASEAVQRVNDESRLSRDVAGVAARLLAAALLCRPDAADRQYGRRPAGRGRCIYSDPLWQAAIESGGDFTLDDGLATVASWAPRLGAGSSSGSDVAAARAAWMILRVRAAAAGFAAMQAQAQAERSGGDGASLAMLMARNLGPSGPPSFHVRAHACVMAYVSGAQAAGSQLSACGPGTRLLATEAASALQRSLQDVTSDFPLDPPRQLAAAAWPALACAAVHAMSSDSGNLGPDCALAAAWLAAAVVTAGAGELCSSSSSSSARAGPGGGDPVLVWEALLAATQALVLLASDSALTRESSKPDDSSSTSAGCIPPWGAPCEGEQLRGALEALCSMHLSSPRHQQVVSEVAVIEGMVADELQCSAAAALSACFGQLGLRPSGVAACATTCTNGLQEDKDKLCGGSRRDGGVLSPLWTLPRNADSPDVVLTGRSGWQLPAHGVVLAAASPVLQQHLLAAAQSSDCSSSGTGTGLDCSRCNNGPLQLRLADSVDPLALERLLDWAYSGCVQLPPEALPLHIPVAAAAAAAVAGSVTAASPRQGLRLLARALQMPGLGALCTARLPLPGERLPRLAPLYADVALPKGSVELELDDIHNTLCSVDGAKNSSNEEVRVHEPSAAQIVSAAHEAALHLPREAAISTTPALGAPFADVWLAAPIIHESFSTSGGRALLLPAHRLLLAARGPYFAAAASSRWVSAAAGADSGGVNGSASRVRPLPVIVLPDADAEVAMPLLAWLYGQEDWMCAQDTPTSSSTLNKPVSAGHGSGCCVCRDARVAVRLCHCAEPLLLPALAADAEAQLRTRLLPPLPARCLAALLRDCAELGLGVAAEATFERLVAVIAQPGPAANDLSASCEWSGLPHQLRQTVEQAAVRQRRAGGGSEHGEEEPLAAHAGATAVGAAPAHRPRTDDAGESTICNLKDRLGPLMMRLAATLA